MSEKLDPSSGANRVKPRGPLPAALSRREFMRSASLAALAATVPVFGRACAKPARSARPNIVLIYADDLGYGDVGGGAVKVPTPAIDALSARGLRFTNAHSPAATCTPSRYALLTGEYAWRRERTGIATGDANLIIEPGRTTLASMLRDAGYATGAVGKWHLGLGRGEIDWNGEIRPGPAEIGFDYSFLIPATGDRVPCVYVENSRIVGLDPADPIRVSFGEPVGDEPTGKNRPDLLRLRPSHGHDQTIVNGVSRIGYMSGGAAARWVDEDMADMITSKAVSFIERNAAGPFFLYFSTHDIHVPRLPHPRFAGVSGLGPRGDAIVEFDWSVGEVVRELDRLGLADGTLLVLTSDNGPVVDDGYEDRAVDLLDGHAPSGPLRGGKYSAFEAGTRVPLIVRWPGRVKPATSPALVSQVDFLTTFAAIAGGAIGPDDGPDSFDLSRALLGYDRAGRDHLVEQARGLSLIEGRYKYIEPGPGPAYEPNVAIELGNSPEPQLYDLEADLGERKNLAAERPDLVRRLSARLEKIRRDGRSSKP